MSSGVANLYIGEAQWGFRPRGVEFDPAVQDRFTSQPCLRLEFRQTIDNRFPFRDLA